MSKYEQLKHDLRERSEGGIALAFSGGVDSSYLLYAALRYGARVRAYYVNSAFQPRFELEDARRLRKSGKQPEKQESN